LFTGIYIPRGAKIGGGLKIYHFSGIIINPLSIIGSGCTLRQGVTIGNKNEIRDVPIIGNNVDFGAGSIAMGAIRIGNNVSIGANAVVISDVPDNYIAVGVPAKIFKKKEL
jgi:serine O-acetyltransferase